MKLNKQTTTVAAVVAGVLTMAAIARTQERTPTERTNTKTTARTASKLAGNEDIIDATACFMELFDRRTISVGRGGILAFVKPEEGFLVKKDEQIAKVRDEVAAAQFATATKQFENDVEIRFGEKSAEVAQAEWMQSLKSNTLVPGTVGELELKRLKLAYERAVLQIDNAKKEREIAGSKRDEAGEVLQTHVVESPISGVVTKVHKRTGEAVREGDPIVDVVNTERVRVSGYIPYKDISRVRIGDKVVAKLEILNADIPEENLRFEGRITYIDVNVTRSKSPEAKIFAEIANHEGVLKDGNSAAMVVYPNKPFAPVNATTQRQAPRRTGADE